jgi:uncharacterized protein (DUF983 family)
MQRVGMAPVILARSLRLRCPRCGKGAFLKHGVTTHVACEVCSLRFEREEGYWTGAIYVNLITTQFLIVGTLFLLMFGTDLTLWWQIGILATLAVVFPTLFYPFSKSIWLGMDYFFTDKPWPQAPTGSNRT